MPEGAAASPALAHALAVKKSRRRDVASSPASDLSEATPASSARGAQLFGHSTRSPPGGVRMDRMMAFSIVRVSSFA